jgi:hypothetical protein
MFTIRDYNMNQSLVDCLFGIDQQAPHRKNDFYKSLSPSVLEQNIWWAEEILNLRLNPKRVNVFGAGFAFYQGYLFQRTRMENVALYDYDPDAMWLNWRALHHIRKNVEIEQKQLDVFLDHEYIRRDIDMVINTSCECMYDMSWIVEKYEKDVTFVLQSTNKPDRGNINTHESLGRFITSTGIGNILYAEKKNIDNHERYMVIGSRK